MNRFVFSGKISAITKTGNVTRKNRNTIIVALNQCFTNRLSGFTARTILKAGQ